MTQLSLKAACAALAVAIAAPALAQVAPPAPPAPPPGPAVIRISPGMEGRRWVDRFEGMSPEGRRILSEAMRPQMTPQDRQATKAARDRVLALIAADKLDVAAVRRAQAAERELVVRQHEKQQAAMLEAYQKLSLADRKAFVEGMQDQEDRMRRHMERARQQLEQSRQRLDEMEKRMRERMKEREGALIIGPTTPIAYPLTMVAAR